MLSEHSFNEMPHENVLLPLPDQVEGLPELFYNSIGAKAPKYPDRSKEAEGIGIKISKQSDNGHIFYRITWDKPWTESGTTYTLVAYDENDELLGAIKSVNGKDRARAVIGAAVVETSSYIWWYDSDWWTEQEFLRLRVIVTFDDGTAVVSAPVDKEF